MHVRLANKMSLLVKVERVLLVTGFVLCGAYALTAVHSRIAARDAVTRFKELQSTVGASVAEKKEGPRKTESKGGFRLWSKKRIQAYLDSLEKHSEPPLAILRIDRLGIEVPVFNGTDDLTLDRGAGRIIGSGRPGEGGNIGISAHRDGFFRALKDVQKGDSIELELPNGITETYVVDQIQIVSPDNVEILKPRTAPSVTLVTCFPFYFIGSAPNRFIVQGSRRR